MSAATCTTCGTAVPVAFAKRGRVCPTCLILAARPPRMEKDEPAGLLTTRWAETFPQYELEELLLEARDRRAWAARDLEANRRPVVLQVVSGATLDEAGGANILLLRANRLRGLNVPGLARVLDAGELPYAFFLVTERHETWLPVAPELAPTDAGALDRLLTRASGILAIARQDGLALPFDLATTFRDSATDRLFLTPSALPPDTADDDAAVHTRSVILASGMEVGGFLLEEKVGEGGFGEVWRAQQDRPVRRVVAVKVLKHGLASPRLLARFEVEQQALARLEHPHIARFFHGDTTADGRPFFAMEWIEGESFTCHCQKTKADTPERLELFRQVCEAVHYAHQKGIIHRDLKPSNVMVSTAGDVPTVKVIDFGIAGALEEPLTDQTRLTRAVEVLGTPASMSPEQAAGEELDARSDVYALGVLLYELLTGQLPFDPNLPIDELRRRIREDDPPRPSARIDDRHEQRAVKGELDWITMRCLEKDPTRRYRSAWALLRDLERHQNEEPVEAGPPELGYRVRKFVQRHRSMVAMSAVVIAAVLIGLGASISGYRKARHNAQVAEQAKGVAEERLSESEAARKEAEAIAGFVEELLSVDDHKGDASMTLDDLLARGKALLDPDSFSYEQRRLDLLNLIARIHANRGRIDVAIPLLEEIRRQRLATLEPAHEKTLGTSTALSWCYKEVGRDEEALELRREAALERMQVADPPLPSKRLSRALTDLGGSLQLAGRHSEGLELFEEAVELIPEAAEENGSSSTERLFIRALSRAGLAGQAVGRAEDLVSRAKAKIGPKGHLPPWRRWGRSRMPINKSDGTRMPLRSTKNKSGSGNGASGRFT